LQVFVRVRNGLQGKFGRTCYKNYRRFQLPKVTDLIQAQRPRNSGG